MNEVTGLINTEEWISVKHHKAAMLTMELEIEELARQVEFYKQELKYAEQEVRDAYDAGRQDESDFYREPW